MSARPARRILHLCYCVADAAPAVALFESLGWRNTMSTPMERWDGTTLGLPGEAEASAHFVYDPRGPRTSPAVEVQQWAEPPLAGEPPATPTTAGIQALGVATASVDATVKSIGGTVVWAGAAWTTVADDRGVRFDVVEDAGLGPGEVRYRHIRVTTTDLAASLRWWDALGFDVVSRSTESDLLGVAREAELVRLRLPDEPTEVVLVSWPGAVTGRHPADANHAGLFRLALGVDDTNAAYDAMRAEGVEFDRAPIEVALNDTPVPDMWICFLSDPDGVPVELVQRPRAAFR